MPKFKETFCSQCGGAFGAGDSGFSHCRQHSRNEAFSKDTSMSAQFTMTGSYSKDIERKLNEVADMIAATLDQPTDPRAWDHLLAYAPRAALERRLQTLNP